MIPRRSTGPSSLFTVFPKSSLYLLLRASGNREEEPVPVQHVRLLREIWLNLNSCESSYRT